MFVLLWATGFIGAKFGLPYAPPLGFLSLRFALVIALMTAIAKEYLCKKIFKDDLFTRRDALLEEYTESKMEVVNVTKHP